jgi:hypothetical protein
LWCHIEQLFRSRRYKFPINLVIRNRRFYQAIHWAEARHQFRQAFLFLQRLIRNDSYVQTDSAVMDGHISQPFAAARV